MRGLFIFHQVNQLVSLSKRQMPEYTSSLRRKLFFFPGLEEEKWKRVALLVTQYAEQMVNKSTWILKMANNGGSQNTHYCDQTDVNLCCGICFRSVLQRHHVEWTENYADIWHWIYRAIDIFFRAIDSLLSRYLYTGTNMQTMNHTLHNTCCHVWPPFHCLMIILGLR